jgi:localization factor PodJL
MTRPYSPGSGGSFDPRDPYRDPGRRAASADPLLASRSDPDRSGAFAGAGKARLVDDVTGILAGLRDRLDARDAEPGRRSPSGDAPWAPPLHEPPRGYGAPPSAAAARDGAPRGDLGNLRADILDLQRGMGALATRSEILDIERQIRALAAEVVETRSPGAVAALADRLDAVQAQIGRLAGEIPAGLHQRIASAIELLNWKVDSARGADPADLRALAAELAALRRGLAEIAEPRRLEELAHEIASLRGLVADLRLRAGPEDLASLREDLSSTRGEIVAQGDDLAALRTTFEGMRRALVGEGGAAASLPALRSEMAQRLDALLRRPPPESLNPIASRLASIEDDLKRLRTQPAPDLVPIANRLTGIEDGLTRLRTQPAPDLAALAASVEQVAGIRGMEADRLAGRFDHVDGMLRTIRDRAEQSGGTLAASQVTLAAIDRKVGEVAAKFDLDSLSALRDSLRAAAGAPQGTGTDPALLGRLQALDDRLRELAARGPERLDPVLRDQLAAIAGRLDRLSAGRGDAGTAAALSDDLAGRLARIEELLAAQRPVAEGLVAGVERLGRLEESLTGRAPALDQIAQSLERLDDGLRHVARVSDTASVEILLRSLGGRLDEIHASREQVERLEAQIAALAAALDRNGRPDPAIELLHQTIGAAVAEMRSLREDGPAGAAPRPDSGGRETRNPTSGGEAAPADLEPILRDLQDLRAEGAAREGRTQESLAAIQTALGTLALRVSQRDAGPARPSPANDAARPAPPLVAAPDSGARIAAAEGGQTSWTARFRAALQRRGAPAPAPAPAAPAAPGMPAPPPRDLDDVPAAAASPEPEGPAPEPAFPKAPEFRPIVLGSSGPDEPSRIRSSFIAALRRNQAEGRAPGGEDGKPPGRRLQTILLVGAAATALAAGAWALGGPKRMGDMVAGVTGQPATGSAESGRTPSGPARKAVAQVVPIAKPVADAPKHPDSMGAPVAPAPPAEAGARTPATAAEAARPTERPSPVETASLAARPPADDLPAGIPARLKPAVLAGNPSALYELASLLVQGRDMPKDPALGARMLERAALAGLVPAQFSLGQLYETGVGVPQDLAQAQVWYRRAAERGNTYAMQNLGVLVAAGTDGKTDYPAAIPWFRQAADLGVRDSQYNLAVILAWGMGTPRNPVEAYKWFALAAKAGDPEAAAKRDELARELSPSDLTAAKALAEAWRARTTDRAANTVPPVPQGLSEASPSKPSSRRA